MWPFLVEYEIVVQFNDLLAFLFYHFQDRIMDKLRSISGPTIDLPPQQEKDKKFGGNCRLYVGNAGTNFTDKDLVEMFKPYGETSEPFYSAEKNFGFIKMVSGKSL